MGKINIRGISQEDLDRANSLWYVGGAQPKIHLVHGGRTLTLGEDDDGAKDHGVQIVVGGARYFFVSLFTSIKGAKGIRIDQKSDKKGSCEFLVDPEGDLRAWDSHHGWYSTDKLREVQSVRVDLRRCSIMLLRGDDTPIRDAINKSTCMLGSLPAIEFALSLLSSLLNDTFTEINGDSQSVVLQRDSFARAETTTPAE